MKNSLTQALLALVWLVSCRAGETPPSSQDTLIRKYDINERWQALCQAGGLFGIARQSSLELSANDFTKTTLFSNRSDCSSADIRVIEKGDFILGNRLQEGVSQINFYYSRVSTQALTPAGVDFLNSLKFCGKRDWTAGEAVDVVIESGTMNCWNRTPRAVYDIYSIEGVQLYFGRGEDAAKLEIAQRPQELNRKDYFLRR